MPYVYSFTKQESGYAQDWIIVNEAFDTMEITESFEDGRPAISFRSNQDGCSEKADNIIVSNNDSFVLISKVFNSETSVLKYRTTVIDFNTGKSSSGDLSFLYPTVLDDKYTILVNSNGYSKIHIYENFYSNDK